MQNRNALPFQSSADTWVQASLSPLEFTAVFAIIRSVSELRESTAIITGLCWHEYDKQQSMRQNFHPSSSTGMNYHPLLLFEKDHIECFKEIRLVHSAEALG